MKTLLLPLFIFLLTACATSVNVDYRAGSDLSHIKTFSVQGQPVNAFTDTRIDSPFMQQRILEAIRENLVSKGLSLNESNTEMIVKYHLSVKQEIESDDTGFIFGFGSGSRHSFFGMSYIFPEREISSVDNLMMTIDMFDTDDNLLWRGSLVRRLPDGSNPASNTRLINGLVKEILDQFPPK